MWVWSIPVDVVAEDGHPTQEVVSVMHGRLLVSRSEETSDEASIVADVEIRSGGLEKVVSLMRNCNRKAQMSVAETEMAVLRATRYISINHN